MKQALYYSGGIFRGEPHPHETTKEARYNPLASVTYWAVIYLLLPIVLLSGLLFMLPQFAPDRIFSMDGLLPMAMLHYLSGAAVVMFMGGRGDIQTVAQWNDGIWTFEIARKLITNSETDVNFSDLSKTYGFGLAVFDNAQVHHSFVKASLILSFK